MRNPPKISPVKRNAFKDWWEDIVYDGSKLFALFILLVITVSGIVIRICDIATTMTTTESAQVSAIGIRGITVEYEGRYGEGATATLNTDDPSQFTVGDTIDIQVKDSYIRIKPRVTLVGFDAIEGGEDMR